MQWLMLQQEKPQDYVIATGQQYTVKEFIAEAVNNLGMQLKWQGEGVQEVGLLDGKVAIRIDPKYYRPTEVQTLLGDPSKAKQELGWSPRTSFKELVQEMMTADLKKIKSP